MAASPAGSSIGLAILTLASLATGFLAANVSTADAFERVGEIGAPDHAYSLNLSAGERVRFSLEGEGRPSAGVAVFDPGDRFVEHVRLNGPGHRDVVADESGWWVLVPTQRSLGTLTVQVPADGSADARAGGPSLEPLPLSTGEQVVATGDDEPLRVEAAAQIDRQPALVAFAVEGSARSLEATAYSPWGRAFTVQTASLEGPQPLSRAVDRGRLNPGNLVDGAYRVSATAKALDGRLLLLHAAYERPQQHRPPLNEALATLPNEGVPVASMLPGEAYLVDAQGARELRLAAARGTTAHVYVYDARNELDALARMGRARGYAWDWSNGSRPILETVTIPIHDRSSYVVYLARLDGPGERVHALLPGMRTAREARQLDVVETSLHVGGATVTTDGRQEIEQNLTGGLVDVRLRVDDAFGSEHRVRVAGPNGVVFDHREQTTVAGQTPQRSHREHPSHFSDGLFRVIVESEQTVDGDAWLTLRHYRR